MREGEQEGKHPKTEKKKSRKTQFVSRPGTRRSNFFFSLSVFFSYPFSVSPSLHLSRLSIFNQLGVLCPSTLEMNVHRIVSHCHAFFFFLLLDDQSSSMMNCFPTGTESDLFDVDEKCLLFFSESLLSTEVTAAFHMIYAYVCHLRRQEARTTQIVCHFFSLMFFIINRWID
jgi:hypothetical protein